MTRWFIDDDEVTRPYFDAVHFMRQTLYGGAFLYTTQSHTDYPGDTVIRLLSQERVTVR